MPQLVTPEDNMLDIYSQVFPWPPIDFIIDH